MLEALFVWMGTGALVLLFFCAAFGTVEKELGVGDTILILLLFMGLWPIAMYLISRIDTENIL